MSDVSEISNQGNSSNSIEIVLKQVLERLQKIEESNEKANAQRLLERKLEEISRVNEEDEMQDMLQGTDDDNENDDIDHDTDKGSDELSNRDDSRSMSLARTESSRNHLEEKSSFKRKRNPIGKLTNIYKFNGSEFGLWKNKVINYLMQFDLVGYLENDMRASEPEVDAAVVLYFIDCCTGSAAKLLAVKKNTLSARKVWRAISKRFGVSGCREIKHLEKKLGGIDNATE